MLGHVAGATHYLRRILKLPAQNSKLRDTSSSADGYVRALSVTIRTSLSFGLSRSGEEFAANQMKLSCAQ